MKYRHVYVVWTYDRDTGSYHATNNSTSYAAACAIAQTAQEMHGLAYVEKPDGTYWYPGTD